MDLIQVLGQKDVRREVQVKDENTAGQLLVKNTLADDVLDEAVSGVNAPNGIYEECLRLLKSTLLIGKIVQ